MSTAVAESVTPVTPDAPVDLASAFYGSPSIGGTGHITEPQPTSMPETDSGPATPPQETVAPAVEAKNDPAKEAQEKEEKHRQAARRLGKQVQELEAKLGELAEQNRILTAKMNGEELQDPTPEEIRERAEFQGRELASIEAANRLFGEDVVQERILAPGSEFRQLLGHRWVQEKVKASQQPVVTARYILAEQEMYQKYGNDPTQWVRKIIEEAKPAIVEEVRKTIKTPVVGTHAPTVTQARGNGGTPEKPKTVLDVFYPSRER